MIRLRLRRGWDTMNAMVGLHEGGEFYELVGCLPRRY